jgi:hypothetical protein
VLVREEPTVDHPPGESESSEKAKVMTEEKDGNHISELGAEHLDSEDEKGLDCPLEREISFEESKVLLAASKERKISASIEKS